MGMSAFYDVYNTEEAQAEARAALDKAIEMEGMMLDTADVYGPYTNEQLIGKKHHPSNFTVTDRNVAQAKQLQAEERKSKLQRNAQPK